MHERHSCIHELAAAWYTTCPRIGSSSSGPRVVSPQLCYAALQGFTCFWMRLNQVQFAESPSRRLRIPRATGGKSAPQIGDARGRSRRSMVAAGSCAVRRDGVRAAASRLRSSPTVAAAPRRTGESDRDCPVGDRGEVRLEPRHGCDRLPETHGTRRGRQLFCALRLSRLRGRLLVVVRKPATERRGPSIRSARSGANTTFAMRLIAKRQRDREPRLRQRRAEQHRRRSPTVGPSS
jgi:hypothetical protein